MNKRQHHLLSMIFNRWLHFIDKATLSVVLSYSDLFRLNGPALLHSVRAYLAHPARLRPRSVYCLPVQGNISGGSMPKKKTMEVRRIHRLQAVGV